MAEKRSKYTFRVVTFLKRKELDFLDRLAKDIYFNYGIHIPRTRLIEEIIDAFKDNNESELKKAERDLIARFKQEEDKIKKQLEK